MALPTTLGLAAFYDLIKISEVDFRPEWSQQRSMTGGGEVLYADRAPMRWMADITTPAMPLAEAEAMMALVNSRGGGLRTVLLTNPRLPFPSTDPDGSIFGAATPAVGTITDRLHVAFTGFPGGYVVPAGTWFQVVYDTSRYYLGQFAEAKTANGSGNISAAEVTPALPFLVETGNAVTVIKPAAKFKITPNTAYLSNVDFVLASLTFSAEQTYAK